MIIDNEARIRQLTEFSRCLNTASGKALVEELETMWDPYVMKAATAEDTIYNIGLRDAFKFLQHIQRGKFE